MYRTDVDEFERIAGFLETEWVELIDGFIVERGDMDPPHVIVSEVLRRKLEGLISGRKWFVREDKPVRVHRTYRPLPDFAVVQGTPFTYEDRHPAAADVALVIEFSDKTLRKDRGEKRVNFEKGGTGVYWIVNLIDRQVEVYTLRRRGGYGKPRIFKSGQSVPVVIEGKEVGRVAVTEILPRLKPGAGNLDDTPKTDS